MDLRGRRTLDPTTPTRHRSEGGGEGTIAEDIERLNAGRVGQEEEGADASRLALPNAQTSAQEA